MMNIAHLPMSMPSLRELTAPVSAWIDAHVLLPDELGSNFQVVNLETINRSREDAGLNPLAAADLVCAICYAENGADSWSGHIPEGQRAFQHFGHSECIAQWLVNHPNCPHCRERVGPDIVRQNTTGDRIVRWLREPDPLKIHSLTGKMDVVVITSLAALMSGYLQLLIKKIMPQAGNIIHVDHLQFHLGTQWEEFAVISLSSFTTITLLHLITTVVSKIFPVHRLRGKAKRMIEIALTGASLILSYKINAYFFSRIFYLNTVRTPADFLEKKEIVAQIGHFFSGGGLEGRITKCLQLGINPHIIQSFIDEQFALLSAMLAQSLLPILIFGLGYEEL